MLRSLRSGKICLRISYFRVDWLSERLVIEDLIKIMKDVILERRPEQSYRVGSGPATLADFHNPDDSNTSEQ